MSNCSSARAMIRAYISTRAPRRIATSNSTKRTETWEKSLKDYQSTLKLNPQDTDAKFNYEFVKKRLEELKQQQQQSQQKKSDQDKKQDQQQQQQNQQNEQAKNDQQQKEQSH